VRWPGPAPGVMHAGWQLLAGPPGPEGAGRVGGVPLPARQDLLHGELIGPQHQDVDVTVLSDRPPGGQLDRVAARDPPPGRAAEQLKRPVPGWLAPTAPGRLCLHVSESAGPAGHGHHPHSRTRRSWPRAESSDTVVGVAGPVERSEAPGLRAATRAPGAGARTAADDAASAAIFLPRVPFSPAGGISYLPAACRVPAMSQPCQ
jgi:hypothetical protein